ncbi:MAG TPA: amidohydrolase family protein [Verrucomicrobiae bacterium]
MSGPIIDTNVFLGRWPFRRLPLDEAPLLAKALRERGVEQAWAGSFDALLHHDVDGVNGRLAALCQRTDEKLFLPIGTVNPALPDWEEDLRRCQEKYRMLGIRVFPNYHQYAVNAPSFVKFLKLATERGMFVQLAVSMEDERTQHPLVQVPHVDLAPLVDVLKATPGVRLQLLNAFRSLRPDLLLKLVSAAHVSVEIATLEGVAGIEELLKQVPVERLMFGSLAPLFYFEAAALKLKESKLSEAQATAICRGNAVQFLKR